MRFPRKRGSTSVMLRIFIPDNSLSTGAGLTGLTSSSTNLAIAYCRELAASFTQITGANLVTITTIGTWASPGTGKLGFKAVDATNMPGLYEVHFPDDAAAFGTGDTSQAVIINILELTTAVLKIGPNAVLVPLVPWDYQDGVRMGLTALPNAAAEASGGLPTLSAAQASNGTIQANVHRWLTGTPNALQSGRVDSYLGAVASGVIAAASFAANALDAVWSTTVRLLTAGTNIVLAKGTGVTGFNDLDAAGVRSAVGLASANLDTQLDALPTNAELATALGTADDAVLTAIDALPTNAELATALGTADDAVLTQLALIKTKTDSLTFTVAGKVDSNITHVNEIPVTGDGEVGSEWGPV